jgi:cytochrome c oxidase cbb3-type subunit IV
MEFAINDLRAAVTAVSFVLFLGIVAWAWSGHRKRAFEEAARLVLDDDDRASGRNEPHPRTGT